jgi:uncharacterized protein YjbI with pentapeptide repeats
VVACEEPESPRAQDHYRAALARRLDKDRAAVASLSDSDLMPPHTSGVAPNIGELEEGRWTKSSGAGRRKTRRGMERAWAEARAHILAEGLDPKEFGFEGGPPPEPAEPPQDLDELVAYLDAQEARGKTELAAMDARRAELEREAEAELAQMGQDGRPIQRGDEPGPPAFRAAEHLRELRGAAASARAGGTPIAELEAMLADPELEERLVRQEHELLDLYRRSAHLRNVAGADPDRGAAARALVQAALDSGEGLAGRDLTGATLAGMTLGGLDLSGALLEAADLRSCQLREARLERTVLAHANLAGAELGRARLSGANLGAADLTCARLDDAALDDAVLMRAKLAKASLRRADLRGAQWLEALLREADMEGAHLGNAVLLKLDLTGCSFRGADLEQATFIECTLDGADFGAARLDKASFVACQGDGVSFRGARIQQGVIVHGSALANADFRDADVEKLNLRGTQLRGARLDRARLDGSDLSECDLERASLERASLRNALLIRTKLDGSSGRGANLMDALLSKATLRGADFSGANLYRADLSRARGDRGTRFTDAQVSRVRTQPRAPGTDGGLP